jgi:DNA-damage-inducible protein D
MVKIGSEAEREIKDFKLSRYACYLIVQNGDSSKKIIALGQTYFAVMTRTQEKTQESLGILEEKARISIRKQLAEHNKSLAVTAKSAGVQEGLDFAVFQNKGYEGLYGGLDAQGIHNKKKLKKSQKILDYMGSTELAANLFRATQTEEKIKRENIYGKDKANRAHYDIGAKVRLTIKEMGGTMPESLETPNKSIQQIERKQNKISVPGSEEE